MLLAHAGGGSSEEPLLGRASSSGRSTLSDILPKPPKGRRFIKGTYPRPKGRRSPIPHIHPSPDSPKGDGGGVVAPPGEPPFGE